ncbi:MAG: 50S ribosomal protein L23 [Candidatus Magasanikbacteria bacterium GW2011_GWA2_46_17]|uniref:Large ribosomal subunit protein uL23 n=1 Tax=Candidatus Magasanikbacteria bacterium GW2011_GWA2_46_17 TaxID=1619042 RepID=A0A0G1P381_9BACT|nr:MAG: 50S ribosomal protein L23 [Candidatus Magasanikbacteria bacterium GW2011_GWA2_46_17]
MGLINKWFQKKQKDQLDEMSSKNIKVAKPEAAKVVKKEVVAGPKKKEKRTSAGDHGILVRPLVTEKSAVAGSHGKYVFVIKQTATKNQVKLAVESLYGVRPETVRVANVQGRRVRFGRSLGKRSDYKKAIVTLPKGKTINLHSGV